MQFMYRDVPIVARVIVLQSSLGVFVEINSLSIDQIEIKFN
jgi:hypothetical protein